MWGAAAVRVNLAKSGMATSRYPFINWYGYSFGVLFMVPRSSDNIIIIG